MSEKAGSTKKPAPVRIGKHDVERVLITGASAGIGADLAREFARHGHKLALVARRSDKLAELSAELGKSFGVDVMTVPGDLSKPSGCKAVVDVLDAAGEQVDILVNNAGVVEVGSFAACETEKLLNLVNLNIVALTHLASLLLPRMVERKFGRILNVASLAAFQPVPSMAAYAASKAYVLSLTEALSEELRGTDVKVTALCPGLTDTDMVAGIKQRWASVRGVPSQLISDPKDVARQAYGALVRGQVVLVPGVPNQVAAAWAQVTPRWILRSFTGFASRYAEWMRGAQ
ncbi:MAG TPA: SDR family oxidoreductase [Candidatus Binatia bacterium]|nr:SDR family oxidoreductase [Candidatus Binatia bacterium]